MATPQHHAQFYEQDDFLIETASGFLAVGMASQATCLVIATKNHCDGFAQRLHKRGYDVFGASQKGTYIAWDAASTLSQFLVDGLPDHERFVHTLGPQIEQAALNGYGVRIFGEMTAILWMQGKREAALALEDSWNTLLDRFSNVTLLCAYPLLRFSEEEDRRQFLHLSHQHAHIIPAESYTLLTNPQERLRTITRLQQEAVALQAEIAKNSASTHLVKELLHLLTTLKMTNEQLEQASTTFHHFLATMGHEFRTGLTSIQGFSELLSTQEWEPQEIKEYARDIMTDAQRLTRLIEEVLDLERMKGRKAELRWELLDVNALLRRLATQTQHTTSIHRLCCHLDETLPLLPGDQDKFIQVITNLLSNAVKYSPRGGEIVLSSQRKEETLQISIQDQGIGIPTEAQDAIFQPYNRMQSEQTRYIQGTGLGLSIVREIIHLHGGTIWVESAPEHGSIFHISLPLIRICAEAALYQ